MAVSDMNPNENNKPAKDGTKPKDKKERPFTKVVVRRLPPTMDKDNFITQVSPLADYDYIYTVKGDQSLGENSFSRAYINFINACDVYLFKEKFDNYVFVDQKGHEYPAVVEFASFQKIPRKRKPRPDPKCATIESDPYYLEFVESLKHQPNQEEKPEFSYQFASEDKVEVVTTPLLDYIKQKRIDKQRIREERRDERRRREMERKKFREDERKRHEPKSPAKTIIKSSSAMKSSKGSATSLDSVKEEIAGTKVKSEDEKDVPAVQKAVAPSTSMHKELRHDDKKYFAKPKVKYMSRSEKLEFSEKKAEYKRRDDYRDKDKEFRNRRFDDYKKDAAEMKDTPRKARKYSEKREERINEAKKAEQKRMKQSLAKSETVFEDANKNEEVPIKQNIAEDKEKEENKDDNSGEKAENNEDVITEGSDNSKPKDNDEVLDDSENGRIERNGKSKLKDHDPRAQRRIRNKDRPTMMIYQPGMLSKRRTTDGTDADSQGTNKSN